METHYRGVKNQKPPSTWKTGISREPKAGVAKSSGVVAQEDGGIPTVDLSKMDGASKQAASHAKIMKQWKFNRLRRKGLIPGDVEKARENFYKNNISDDYNQPLSIYSTSLSALNKYGESLRIYFSFMEQLLWLSIVLTVLASINIIINYEGGYYNSTDQSSRSDSAREPQELLGRLNLLTVANFNGYTNFTTDPHALDWVDESTQPRVFYMFMDTVLTIMIVSWVFFFKVYSGVVAEVINQDKVQASLYSVQVKGLPTKREEGAPNEIELKNHFSKFGPVHSVSLIRNTGALLPIYQLAQEKLFQSEMATEIVDANKKEGRDISKGELEAPKSLRKQYTELLNIGESMNPQRYRLDQFPIVSAIVIFEKPKSRDVCLYAHRKMAPEYTLNCMRKVPLEFLFRGHYHLTVEEPPEPHAIYWQNYRENVARKLVFGFLLSMIIIICLGITLSFTFVLKERFEAINFSTYCPKQYLYAKPENVVSDEELQYINNCFCERLSIVQVAFGWQRQYQPQCAQYVSQIGNYYIALPVYGVVIAVINWTLKKAVLVGTGWMRYRDITSEAKFQMTLLFALQFMNMTLPLMMINFNWSHQEWVQNIQKELFFDFAGPRTGADLFFGGRHTDTNREFWTTINQPLHFVMLIVLLGPAAGAVISNVWASAWTSILATTKYLQCELDELYEGQEFQLPLKLGQHLAYTTSILVFSAAIPDLLLLLPIYFALHFWIDKWLILRLCRVPPRFDISLNDRANNILGFAILVHIVCTVQIFTTPAIFPDKVLVHEASTGARYFYTEPLGITVRFLNPTVSSYLLLFAVTLCVFFLVEPVALEIAKACCFKPPRRGQRVRNGTMRTFSIESIQASKVRENFNYDMMKSKKYRRALLLLNQQDIDEADEDEQRKQPNLDNIEQIGID